MLMPAGHRPSGRLRKMGRRTPREDAGEHRVEVSEDVSVAAKPRGILHVDLGRIVDHVPDVKRYVRGKFLPREQMVGLAGEELVERD